MKSVTIPATVTDIGERAFYGCRELESAAIADGVQTIGAHAFESSAIKSVTLPDSVTTVGSGAFYTGWLETVKTGNGLTRIEDEAFRGVDNIEIGTGVKFISRYAFGTNSNTLTSVRLSDTTGWRISESPSGADSDVATFFYGEDDKSVAKYFNENIKYYWFHK